MSMRTQIAVLGAVLALTASALGGCGGGSTAIAPVRAPTWSARAPMLQARVLFGADVVNGRIYAIGGWGSDFTASHGAHYVDDVESYDPSTNTWTVESTGTSPRYGFSVAAIGNVLYKVGGDSICCDEAYAVDAYDTSSHTWMSKAGMSASRTEFGAVAINNVLYAVGGLHFIDPFAGPAKVVTNTMEAYDPSANTWTSRASMPTARRSIAVGVVNNILYVIGGFGASGVLSTVEAYDPVTNTWTTKAPMPTARAGMALGVVNNVLYVVGGNTAGGVVNTVEAYDPATNTWRAMPPMPTPRDELAAAVVGNVVYAMAGETNGQPLITVEAFTP
jgi:N-acetylneuraminic acid mutarotase